jgi:hypothetical protein
MRAFSIRKGEITIAPHEHFNAAHLMIPIMGPEDCAAAATGDIREKRPHKDMKRSTCRRSGQGSGRREAAQGAKREAASEQQHRRVARLPATRKYSGASPSVNSDAIDRKTAVFTDTDDPKIGTVCPTVSTDYRLLIPDGLS